MELTRLIQRTALTIAVVMLAATPAFADATAFVGANTTPSNRPVRGISGGLGLFSIVMIELEYAITSEDQDAGAPALKTGMANVLLQTPVPVFGFQPYVTGGGGLYRESIDLSGYQQTELGINLGGGVKISLIGPLRLRVDYRVFTMRGGALYSPAHRAYAGLNLKF